ncbi:MAG TPA: hypothetical protein PLG48_05340, partial [Candidatus Avimonas sp.]|nr:hypothetical protein [Candidatus Avimonas sp.]
MKNALKIISMPIPIKTIRVMIIFISRLKPSIESLLISSSTALSINRRAAIASREKMIKVKFLALCLLI